MSWYEQNFGICVTMIMSRDNEATTIVAPQPGIAPKKEPIIGCAHLGPIWLATLSRLFLVAKLISAKPIIDNDTYPPIAPADWRLSKINDQRLNSIYVYSS